MEDTPQPPPQPQSSTEWVHVTGNPRQTATPPATGTSTSEPKSPSAKRRKEERERTRVSRACDRCKKKKTRCTGKCPCPLCLRAGLSCEFTASYTRGRLPSVVVDETALTSSTRPRILMPADAASPASSASPFQFQRPLPSPSQDGGPKSIDVFRDVSKLVTPNENSVGPHLDLPEPTQTDQQGHYVGTSSGVSLILRIQKRLHQSSSLHHDSSIFTFGDAPLPDFDHDHTFFVLPPKAEAERLLKHYFDFAASTHRFLHRPSIEGILHEFYETGGNMRNREDGAAKTALLLSVFAQSQAYMDPHNALQRDSARYFFAAERLLAKERGAMRLASVQARLGQCFYLLAQSRINHCWSLFGTTAHLALAIGLHRGRRADCSKSIDYLEQENRRRLFWCAYTLDKYLAAALGRPQTFKDEDIDQELPTIVNDEDLLPHSMNPAPIKSQSIGMAPVEHVKICRIVGHVLRDLYSIRPPSMTLRVELAAKYSRDLREWRANLSRFLDADGIDSSLIIPIYKRQRNVLNLAYYHAILLVQRPFLLTNFANLASIEKTMTSTLDTSQNITECLDAAMHIVDIVDDMFRGGGMFGAFWNSQYFAFCAVVVLYIARIQQYHLEQGECKGYFNAGQKCQAQLSTISETDCLSKRYCLVLEELRLEAARQTGKIATSPSTNIGSNNDSDLQNIPGPAGMLSGSMPQNDGFGAQFYGGNIPSTPESAIFNNSFMGSSSLMADLTSWGQFDSLVTAGIGMLDGGFQGDDGLGFGMAR